MHKQSLRVVVVLAVALVSALAGADVVSAGGAVPISACQTLSDANTTYKLTADLIGCLECLVVANDKITIDLQGHSITSSCGGGAGIASELNIGRDLIVIKNGSIKGYSFGIGLSTSRRVSVLGVTVRDNSTYGIAVGPDSLVKACEASGSGIGVLVFDRGQVQQCNSHDNANGIEAVGDNCLITMITANENFFSGINVFGNKCTVSYNTANNNSSTGIFAPFSARHLITRNVALNNGNHDYSIGCPSDDSTTTRPTASRVLRPPGHRLSHRQQQLILRASAPGARAGERPAPGSRAPVPICFWSLPSESGR
jgi:hypothetical protein